MLIRGYIQNAKQGQTPKLLKSPIPIFPLLRPNEGGLTQMALMSDSWPVKVCLHIPSLTSHSLADASHAPDTNSRVSGARDRLITSPVCPAKVVVCWPVSMSHRALGRGRAGRGAGR